MIRKLRNKIALINILVITIILLAALFFVFSSGYSRIINEGLTRLQMAIYTVSIGDTDSFSNQTMFNDIVVYTVDNNNTIIATNTNIYNQGDLITKYNSIIDNIIGAEQLSNDLPELDGRYRKEYNESKQITYIAIQDMQTINNSLLQFAIFNLLTLGFCLIAFIVISFLLATLAVRPLKQSWKQQKQFVADASHELKTPLSVIMANTELIAADPKKPVDSQMQWVNNTRQECKRMKELITNMLFLAKHDDGLIVAKQAVDLSSCVYEMALTYDSIFFENHKTFDYDIQSNLFINGNTQQIQQLIGILLDNANKYAVDNGNVQLSLKASGRNAVIIAANDSKALSQEQLKHLFDRFYTIDKSRNKENAGNGLGLSIAQSICISHKGKISANFNNGRLSFVATIPLHKVNHAQKKG